MEVRRLVSSCADLTLGWWRCRDEELEAEWWCWLVERCRSRRWGSWAWRWWSWRAPPHAQVVLIMWHGEDVSVERFLLQRSQELEPLSSLSMLLLVVPLQLVELLLRVLPSPLDQLLHLQLEIFEGLEEAAQVIKLQWKTVLSNFNHFPHPCRSCLRVSWSGGGWKFKSK